MAGYKNGETPRCGPYGGWRIAHVYERHQYGYFLLKPSDKVQNCLKSKDVTLTDGLPTMKVLGLNRGRPERVYQTLVQYWMRTGDNLQSWRAAAIAIDEVNMEMESMADFHGINMSRHR